VYVDGAIWVLVSIYVITTRCENQAYFGNPLSPAAILRPNKARSKHSVALDDGIDGFLDGFGSNTSGNTQDEALVEAAFAAMLHGRFQIHGLDWRQSKWLVGFFLLVCLGHG
jgi:hypothetical protein